MSDKPNTQIIIRHIAGAKINRIDPFALADTTEITFGREASSTVTFDSPKDDVVSRRHAVLLVRNDGEVPSFSIEDLNSSNGTFVNGEKISGERELLPDDTVEFGKGGPKFTFDIQPRPEGMAARTRVMNVIDATATHALSNTAVTSAVTLVPSSDTQSGKKAGVGKNTVMMMLSDERKKTSQVWMGALAAVVAFFLVGGGVLYWNSMQTAERVQLEAQQQSQMQAEKVRAEASNAAKQLTQQIGMPPGEVVQKYGNSTVWINFSWRLFDKGTGRPIFHKRFVFDVGGQKRGLPLSKVFLEFWVQSDVGPVIQDQVQLHFFRVWTRHVCDVQRITIGRHAPGFCAGEILPVTDDGRRQEHAASLSVLR